MTQQFLHIMAGKADAELSAALVKVRFKVATSDRMLGGLDVRVRRDTNDEAAVMAIVSRIAPDAVRGPNGTPAMNLRDYRSGL